MRTTGTPAAFALSPIYPRIKLLSRRLQQGSLSFCAQDQTVRPEAQIFPPRLPASVPVRRPSCPYGGASDLNDAGSRLNERQVSARGIGKKYHHGRERQRACSPPVAFECLQGWQQQTPVRMIATSSCRREGVYFTLRTKVGGTSTTLHARTLPLLPKTRIFM